MKVRLAVLLVSAALARADLLVTSLNTHSVFRYDSSTGAFLDTFISAGSGGLNNPRGIVIAPNGDVLVASFGTDEILRYSSTGAFLDVFADSSSGLEGPFQMAIGPGGVLYVAAAQADSILKYDIASDAFLGVFVSDLNPVALNTPRGLAIGNGLVYTSTEGDRLRYYDILTGAQTATTLGDNPRGLTVGPDNNLYVAFAGPANLVVILDGITAASLGEFVTHDSGGLLTPIGVAFGPDGNFYIASQGTSEILRYDGSTGAFLDAFVAAGSGGLSGPQFFVFRQPIPEPGTVLLTLLGGLCLLALRRR